MDNAKRLWWQCGRSVFVSGRMPWRQVKWSPARHRERCHGESLFESRSHKFQIQNRKAMYSRLQAIKVASRSSTSSYYFQQHSRWDTARVPTLKTKVFWVVLAAKVETRASKVLLWRSHALERLRGLKLDPECQTLLGSKKKRQLDLSPRSCWVSSLSKRKDTWKDEMSRTSFASSREEGNQLPLERGWIPRQRCRIRSPDPGTAVEREKTSWHITS